MHDPSLSSTLTECSEAKQGKVNGRHLGEPEDAFRGWQASSGDFEMQSLFHWHRGWCVLRITWLGLMAHPHYYQLTLLGFFLGIGPRCGGAWTSDAAC